MDFIGTAINVSIVTMLLPLYLLFNSIVSALPDATINPSIQAALEQIMYWAWKADTFFPVQTLVTVVGLSLAFDAASLLVRGVFWIIRTVRGG